MLARVYLQMGAFEEAYGYADKCLQETGSLLNYNDLDFSASYPFPIQGEGNPEIIFYEVASGGNLMARTRMNISDELLESYADGDLRRQAFVLDDQSGRKIYKGSYLGSYSFFIGLATDELYLIRAESAAHLSKLEEALADLNYLRRHRFLFSSFTEYKTTNRFELLDFIAEERRRELPFRNRRWEDLRRWNTFMEDKRSIKRRAASVDYELKHPDPKWTWPLPDLAIQYGEYEQNPR
ncbi:RagB/SusD family nutrient uptake outer membrane protein [Sphingobacterium alkalisoli]|uniref:RagB/SusD family nutrient uptake outer membrane protein n=1 Tax=Sphingobacterium alkalisoli TaxID=1874115 RepID=A0A4U0GLN6_9SPHI|nr:RagB/SusD family nutrient uptake outer membrane protein [Sphingobacterium alkalisoli]TJY59695.1 RagB/SusD family nutrient uptake outer membrane protein [Sphingobacterium alkalisoli]GGH33076.1 hypothetical protein GCM10011418_47040 [Sphingobacterium alkalisoli]